MYTSRDVLIQKTSDQLCKYWVLMTTNKIIRISNKFRGVKGRWERITKSLTCLKLSFM